MERWAREDGFTLIELLVVITVLGILAGVAIPRLSGIQERAQRSVLEANANTIRNVMEMYRTFEGSYPDLDDDINSIADLNEALGDEFSISDLDVEIIDDDEPPFGDDDSFTLTIADDYGNQLTITEESISKDWND
ncbi:type II secretion system GspH family protein [Natroniella sulfidigena]|uniref:type II secretion system protein n=1 Tax=Natroniella sulfidigena TaxID=723921 RepID=UPI00200B6DD2|nr:prepilin-type N-terminal cleavage/methylation domain-containing protein [Natroniella sulfidigena]MCK8816854.1 type II secretion system GspH family protein [Natroniella sulfidigena]